MDHNLSDISTIWPDLRLAHEAPPDLAQEAQLRVLYRYEAPIRRYLRGALRDRDQAEEVYNTFVFRFLRGDFRNADPGRGRFRFLLKTALSHLITDQRRQGRRHFSPLGDLDPEAPSSGDDRAFLEAWRGELIRKAWDALRTFEQSSGKPYYTLLVLRTEHPELRSADIASILAERCGLEVDANWVRKRLTHARGLFVELFVKQVEQTLARPTPELLERELLDLEMLDRCRQVLERRRLR